MFKNPKVRPLQSTSFPQLAIDRWTGSVQAAVFLPWICRFLSLADGISTLCCTTRRARSVLSLSLSPLSLLSNSGSLLSWATKRTRSRKNRWNHFRLPSQHFRPISSSPPSFLPSFLPSFPCLFLFADKTTLDCDLLWRWRTEHAWMRKIVCTWLRDISCWTCFVFLPGPGWLHLNNICKPFSSPLYMPHGHALQLSLLPLCNSHCIPLCDSHCTYCTEAAEKACTCLGEISSCFF